VRGDEQRILRRDAFEVAFIERADAEYLDLRAVDEDAVVARRVSVRARDLDERGDRVRGIVSSTTASTSAVVRWTCPSRAVTATPPTIA
jgi:hypothetical protein